MLRAMRTGSGYRRAPRGIALAMAVLLLGACGFQPVYVPQSTTSGAMSPTADLYAIQVVSPPNRDGQILHNYLLDQLNPNGRPRNPLYRLETTLDVSVRQLGVQADATTSRNSVTVRAQSRLSGAGDTQVFSASSSASFNTTESNYATVIAEEEAVDRSLRAIAADLRLQLAAFFRKARAAQQ